VELQYEQPLNLNLECTQKGTETDLLMSYLVEKPLQSA